MKSLTFAPLVPLALWVALALSAAGVLAWYGISSRDRLTRGRRAIVLALMGLGLALPMLILLNPTWLERLPPPAGKPLLTVLLDRSTSMATRDVEGQSRFEAGRELAASISRELGNRYEVRLRPFASETGQAEPTELSSLSPGDDATDLAQAISAGVNADRPQGQALLLLSDGIHNAGGGAAQVLKSAERAKALAAPIYVKTLGGDTTVRDIEVDLQTPQEVAFVGQQVPVTAFIRQFGFSGAVVKLQLFHEGQEIDSRQASLAPQGQTDAVFQVSQKTPGLYRYEIRAEAQPDEVTAANNAATLLLRVVDVPIRVLLLEGKPYWDTKFLVRTLSSDPSLELVSVVRMAEGRLLEQSIGRSSDTATTPKDESGTGAGTDDKPADTAPAPHTERWKIRKDPQEILGNLDALASYQIVVLGRDADVYLTDTALANLRKWMSRDGGSLVCFRGAPASQIGQGLKPLMPVRWTPMRESRFRVQWTERGRELRWLAGAEGDALSQLPTLASAAQADPRKPLATSLAEVVQNSGQASQPVISFQPFGSGRTVVVEGSGMWRWAFMPPEHQQHDQVYTTLWHSLVRWLVSNTGLLPTQQRMLRTDKVRFISEPATATLLVREESLQERVPAVLLSAEGQPEWKEFTPTPAGDEPGMFRVAFGTLPEGRYLAKLADADEADPAGKTLFEVRRDMREQLDLKSRPDLMARIANDSGGSVLAGNRASQIAEEFERHLSRTRPERVERSMAWDRWWALVGVCLMWTTAWAVRRSGGLV